MGESQFYVYPLKPHAVAVLGVGKKLGEGTKHL